MYPGHPVHPGNCEQEEGRESDGANDPDIIVRLVLDYPIVARDCFVHQITVTHTTSLKILYNTITKY